jgi:hypothetical protein
MLSSTLFCSLHPNRTITEWSNQLLGIYPKEMKWVCLRDRNIVHYSIIHKRQDTESTYQQINVLKNVSHAHKLYTFQSLKEWEAGYGGLHIQFQLSVRWGQEDHTSKPAQGKKSARLYLKSKLGMVDHSIIPAT